MRNYMKPELSMKKFVSNEAIAEDLSTFLTGAGISDDAGITSWLYNSSTGTFTENGTMTAGDLKKQMAGL